MRLGSLATLTAVAAAVACNGDDYGTNGGTSCTPTETQVCMAALAFNPTTRTVPAGTIVTWRNGATVNHTVTSNAGSAEMFDSGQLTPGSTFTHRFNSAGTFQYHCNNHAGMTGTIQVSQ